MIRFIFLRELMLIYLDCFEVGGSVFGWFLVLLVWERGWCIFRLCILSEFKFSGFLILISI